MPNSIRLHHSLLRLPSRSAFGDPAVRRLTGRLRGSPSVTADRRATRAEGARTAQRAGRRRSGQFPRFPGSPMGGHSVPCIPPFVDLDQVAPRHRVYGGSVEQLPTVQEQTMLTKTRRFTAADRVGLIVAVTVLPATAGCGMATVLADAAGWLAMAALRAACSSTGAANAIPASSTSQPVDKQHFMPCFI